MYNKVTEDRKKTADELKQLMQEMEKLDIAKVAIQFSVKTPRGVKCTTANSIKQPKASTLFIQNDK